MKTKLFAVMLLAGSSLFAGVRFSVGIGLGVPVAPVVACAACCAGSGLCAACAWPGIRLGGWLSVFCGRALCLASWLLGSAAIRGSALDCATVLWAPLLSRILAKVRDWQVTENVFGHGFTRMNTDKRPFSIRGYPDRALWQAGVLTRRSWRAVRGLSVYIRGLQGCKAAGDGRE